jgi:hypothetical protein
MIRHGKLQTSFFVGFWITGYRYDSMGLVRFLLIANTGNTTSGFTMNESLYRLV